MSAVAILLILLFVLLALAVPIFISLLLPTMVGLHVSGLGLPASSVVLHAVQGINSFPLLAIPLFVFAADIISRGEIGNRLLDVVDAFVGHIPGGLAVATAVTMAVFGAISGIGMAAIVSIGPIAYPAMIKRGYGQNFTLGLILTGSTLAMLVPPSVAVILYCLQTNQSIAQVFLSALAAGLIFLVLLIAYSVLYAMRRHIGADRRFSLPVAIKALRRAGWSLLLPVIIVGGIYSGFFTVTEAAAVSAVYAMFVEILVYRRIKPGQLLSLGRASAGTIAMIVILIAAGSTLTWFLTIEQVPQSIADVLSSGVPQVGVLGIINGVFLVAGMLVDPNSAIIVLSPLVFPTAMHVGIDPVHLGAILTLNLAIGMISPPFGINLFVGVATFKKHYDECVRGCLPFIGLMLVALAITTYVPDAVMWLPGLSAVH